MGDAAHLLAYRLYSICERKGGPRKPAPTTPSAPPGPTSNAGQANTSSWKIESPRRASKARWGLHDEPDRLMAHPKYARFHKCDLQLQTPAHAARWEQRPSHGAHSTGCFIVSAVYLETGSGRRHPSWPGQAWPTLDSGVGQNEDRQFVAARVDCDCPTSIQELT